MYAAILIRGDVRVRGDIRDTLYMLRLRKKHAAVLIDENNKPLLGMVQKVKDRITYGPISADMQKRLEATMKEGVAHLAPPRGGFERKGIKKAGSEGGALGYRDSMDNIVEKMLR
jgi:large subunit ribosomal protein L30